MTLQSMELIALPRLHTMALSGVAAVVPGERAGPAGPAGLAVRVGRREDHRGWGGEAGGQPDMARMLQGFSFGFKVFFHTGAPTPLNCRVSRSDGGQEISRCRCEVKCLR